MERCKLCSNLIEYLAILSHRTTQSIEKLEVDPSKHVDITNIVMAKQSVAQGPLKLHQSRAPERNNIDFQDNPEVPPLLD